MRSIGRLLVVLLALAPTFWARAACDCTREGASCACAPLQGVARPDADRGERASSCCDDPASKEGVPCAPERAPARPCRHAAPLFAGPVIAPAVCDVAGGILEPAASLAVALVVPADPRATLRASTPSASDVGPPSSATPALLPALTV